MNLKTPPDIVYQSEQLDLRLQLRAAWLYYIEGLTQQEVAERLGLTRLKVTRLVAKALERGIVKISVNSLGTIFPEVEESLCKKFGLRDAVVVVESEEGEPLYHLLALAASEWLIPRLTPDSTIGLSFGRTISHLPLVFRPSRKIACTFTEVIGGLSNSMAGYPHTNIIAKMAELCGGKAEFLNVPTVVSSPNMRQMLIREKAVGEAFQKARDCQFLLTSVGEVSRSAPLYQQGFLSDADLGELRSRGAVGDVMGYFIAANGSPVPSPLDERLMGLELHEITRIPSRVLIAGGREKVTPIKAAIQSGLFNILITDWATAHSLQME